MAELNLRSYQEECINSLRNGFSSGNRCQLLYLPTGAGKTECAIALLKASAEKGSRCVMVMDRRVLVEQTSIRLDGYSLDHGVLMSGHWRFHTYKSIQICSAQTLEKRGSLPNMKLMIVDECHNTRAQTAEFIKNNKDVFVVGLSASPFTKGLGQIYSNVVNGPTTKQLVEKGMLSPLRVFIAKEIDMSGAKKVAGEWSQSEASERGIKITGDIVNEWIKKTHEIFGEAKKTIVFCAGVAHGLDLSEKFKEAGYNFVSISYKDDEETKAQVLAEFSKPDSTIHGLIATDILTKGFDQADVMIGISARPFTKSFSSHVQQLGRIMRPHGDKSDAIWLDHSGNFLRFLEDWEDLYHNGVRALDDGKEKAKKEPTEKEKEAAKCSNCGELWGPLDVCQHCGHVRPRRNTVLAVPGQLEEIRIGKGKTVAASNKAELYAMCAAYARQYSMPEKQKGRAAHIYKDITGEWPPKEFSFEKAPYVEISNPVLNQIKRRNIAFSRARA